jgi:uncharacterized HAD superfamily protein
MFKKAIGIDIDGVIGDSDKIFRKHLNHFFHTALKRKDITEFYYEKVLGMSLEQVKPFWDDFNARKLWLEIPLISNAKTSIDYLKEKYSIILITARNEGLKDLTAQWLAKNQIHYDELYLLAGNETKLTKILQNNICLNALIEDKLENALNFAEEGVRVFLFDYPWNQYAGKKENLTRIQGWKEILSFL